jgi:hypothetical protein
VATDPPADLVLTPLDGRGHTLGEWIVMFDLVVVALDPFTNESAWLLPTAVRLLEVYDEADCRVAWLVTGEPHECRLFLGRWSREILTFADPDRAAVQAMGLERLPALVHIGADGRIVNAAEGWEPDAWRAATEELSRRMSWSKPAIPVPGDPAPYAGSPALD